MHTHTHTHTHAHTHIHTHACTHIHTCTCRGKPGSGGPVILLGPEGLPLPLPPYLQLPQGAVEEEKVRRLELVRVSACALCVCLPVYVYVC